MEFRDLVGMTLAQAEQRGDDVIYLESVDGRKFQLHHSQDCCESVSIESVTGDLSSLIGHPILMAEEATSDERQPGTESVELDDSFTWTFYKLATIKGYVDIRWLGTSNGYYSEAVDFVEIKD